MQVSLTVSMCVCVTLQECRFTVGAAARLCGAGGGGVRRPELAGHGSSSAPRHAQSEGGGPTGRHIRYESRTTTRYSTTMIRTLSAPWCWCCSSLLSLHHQSCSPPRHPTCGPWGSWTRSFSRRWGLCWTLMSWPASSPTCPRSTNSTVSASGFLYAV